MKKPKTKTAAKPTRITSLDADQLARTRGAGVGEVFAWMVENFSDYDPNDEPNDALGVRG